MASNQDWEVEYREAGLCFRTYTDFLIKIVMGFCTANAILFAALTYLVREKPEPGLSILLITTGGVLASSGALVIQRRTHSYWLLYLKRASDLEERHQAELYTKILEHAQSRRLRSCVVVQAVYMIFIVLWLVFFLRAVGLSAISIDL